MTARIVECELHERRIDMPLEAVFEMIEDIPLVRFRPRVRVLLPNEI